MTWRNLPIAQSLPPNCRWSWPEPHRGCRAASVWPKTLACQSSNAAGILSTASVPPRTWRATDLSRTKAISTRRQRGGDCCWPMLSHGTDWRETQYWTAKRTRVSVAGWTLYVLLPCRPRRATDCASSRRSFAALGNGPSAVLTRRCDRDRRSVSHVTRCHSIERPSACRHIRTIAARARSKPIGSLFSKPEERSVSGRIRVAKNGAVFRLRPSNQGPTCAGLAEAQKKSPFRSRPQAVQATWRHLKREITRSMVGAQQVAGIRTCVEKMSLAVFAPIFDGRRSVVTWQKHQFRSQPMPRPSPCPADHFSSGSRQRPQVGTK